MRTHFYPFISVLVVLFDQLTKHLVRNFIDPFETIKVLPFLHLISIRNEGAAFGLFKGFGNVTFIIVSIVAIMFVLYLMLKSDEDKLGLSLILGGAIGNLIDRVISGSVTDFIDVFAGRFHWPAFNVADSALSIGLAVMIVRSVFYLKKGEKADVSGIN
jgi:signal peptidase II